MARYFVALALALIALIALAAARDTVEQCYDIKNSAQCENSQDSVSACQWCNAKAVPSVCVNNDQAQRLPAGVFECQGVKKFQGPVEQCYNIKNADECRRSQDSVGQCKWCIAKAVPSVCANPSQVARLPAGVFVCDQ